MTAGKPRFLDSAVVDRRYSRQIRVGSTASTYV